MNTPHDPWLARAREGLVAFPGEAVPEYRARLALLQATRAEERERELRGQRSTELDAGQRLHAWERLHQLRIPARPPGSLAAVIAGDTGLSLQQLDEALAARKRTPPP